MCTRGSNRALLCGPSTSPLDGMGALLRWLSRQRSWQVFAAVVAIVCVTAPLGAPSTPPLLRVLSAGIGAVVMLGYPLLVIFGFPAPYSTPLRRQIALGSGALLCVVVLTMALAPATSLTAPEWWQAALGLPLVSLLYAPFFLATSVVGDARRALGRYLLGDCIGTWICLFSYPLFGVFFIQRTVASVLVALDAQGSSNLGSALPSNNRWSGP